MDTPDLIIKSHHCLRLTYEEFARRVGSSRRSVQRWVAGQGSPYAHQWKSIAAAVYPRDAELAAQAAERGGTTLEALGLVPKPPPPEPVAPMPPPPEPPPDPTMEQIDAIVCAAADVLDLRPREVRAAVDAVFTRAAKLGYSTVAVARAFETDRAAKPTPGKSP